MKIKGWIGWTLLMAVLLFAALMISVFSPAPWWIAFGLGTAAFLIGAGCLLTLSNRAAKPAETLAQTLAAGKPPVNNGNEMSEELASVTKSICALYNSLNEAHAEIKTLRLSEDELKELNKNTKAELDKLTQNCNGFMDALVRTAKALENGKAEPLRETSYDGKTREAAAALNNYIDALRSFSAEVSETAGGRNFRQSGDVNLTQLRNSVNELKRTFDAFASETADIFTAIAKGSNTVRYSKEYAGAPGAAAEACRAAAAHLKDNAQKTSKIENKTGFAKPFAASAKPALTPAKPTLTPAKPALMPAKPAAASAKPIAPAAKPTETSVAPKKPAARPASGIVSVIKESRFDGSSVYNKKDFGKY